MGLALKMPESPSLRIPQDRPGWIPADILYDWDTCPYAYQTEEELMPAGGLHGYLLLYIAEILRSFLASRNRMLLMDTFLLYRDARGTKQRISPDLMLMPFRFPPPSAYDLDEESPPLAVVEVTSPKSRIRDLKEKVFFYSSLGISSYLVIDAVTSGARLRENIELHMWRQISGKLCRMKPDNEGWLTVPEMNLTVKAEGQRLFFRDRETGEILCDTGELKDRLAKAEETAESEKMRAESEKMRAESEKMRAESEKIRADEAEKAAEIEKEKNRMILEKLRSLGIDPQSLNL